MERPRIVQVSAPMWSFGPVLVAASFLDRWFGLRGVPPGWGVLLQSRSVHGFGMQRPTSVVALARDGLVLRTSILEPRGVVTSADSFWLLEMPVTAPPPPSGIVLSVHAVTHEAENEGASFARFPGKGRT